MNGTYSPFGRSEVRRQILQELLSAPQRRLHVRGLARQINRPAPVVGRELQRLESAGALRSTRVGNQRLYEADPGTQGQLIRQLFQRTLGLERQIVDALAQVPGVERAFIYGSYAAGDDRPDSDVDVFVVGSVKQRALNDHLMNVEKAIGREINATIHREAELDRLRAENSVFVDTVDTSPQIPLDIAHARASIAS